MSSDIGSIIDTLELKNVTLVGHSMGGMASMLYALYNSDKISKLILVDTTAKMGFMVGLYISLTFKIFPYKEYIKGMVDYNHYKPSEKLKTQILETALKVPKDTAGKYLTEFSKTFDIRDKLIQIKIPTIIIVGEYDKATPVKDAEYLNNHIEGSTLYRIPNSKHMPMVDNPEIFNDILAKS